MHRVFLAVDRFVNKLGPVNTLIEHLCERLLPNAVAHASICNSYPCLADWGCGVEIGDAHATYCDDGIELIFQHCGC